MGTPPKARYGHCSHYLKDIGALIIYGGKNNELYQLGLTACFEDIFLLNLGTLAWQSVSVVVGKSIARHSFCSYIHSTP